MEGNLHLMGRFNQEDSSYSNSFFGEMTDVNIWNRGLNQSEVNDWTDCKSNITGNILDWNTAKWNITNGIYNESKTNKSGFCQTPRVRAMIFTGNKKGKYDDTKDLCSRIGGKMLISEKDFLEGDQAIRELAKVNETKCWYKYYTGLKYNDKFKSWTDGSSGENTTIENVKESSGSCECITVATNKGGTKTEKSVSECSTYLCPICNVRERSVFHLQGVCPSSKIDRYYVMKSGVELLGFTNTKMIFSDQSQTWEIINLIDNQKKATMKQKTPFPIGLNTWEFEDENSNCKSQKINFHLHIDDKFFCKNGEIIDIEKACDRFEDCSDSSDEDNCNLITFNANDYDVSKPPMVRKVQEKLVVKVQTTIFDITDLNEDNSLMQISFGLKLTWKDSEISFNFLKNSSIMNSIENETIWTPKISFLNYSKTDDLFFFNEKLFAQKEGKPINDLDSFPQTQKFPGSENSLNSHKSCMAKFICSFNKNEKYPFGQDQKCSFSIYLSGAENRIVDLKQKDLNGPINSGPSSVGQFRVKDWKSFEGIVIGMDTGIQYTVTLSRNNFGSILLSTYLPSLLMNLINQATNYISSPDKYDLIITVNITCMMVLASVYLSVSTSLPTTAAIKPVEIWLLFNLAYPVLVIINNILLQVADLKTN